MNNNKRCLVPIFKEVRDSEGLTNRQFADNLGITYSALLNLLSGHCHIRDFHLKNLIDSTGYTIVLVKKPVTVNKKPAKPQRKRRKN